MYIEDIIVLIRNIGLIRKNIKVNPCVSVLNGKLEEINFSQKIKA
jgi:hypothetical protein